MVDVRGIDVSKWQDPKLLAYSELAKTHRFLIARATSGTVRDEHFLDHIARAKAVGLLVSGYHFFRPGQDVGDQVEAFGEAFAKANLGTGSLVPALDIEQSEFDGPFTPERYVDACHSIAEIWETRWGTPLIYTNPIDWKLLGSPAWLKDYLLWLADYTPPANTPLSLPWTIWQHRVSVLPGVYPGKLDQNIAAYLPVIGSSGS